ncbi:hypothetical protein F4808DRAFT_48384 [Astrocystis sublimbata]|nr:hypothetical protein F4808DRAFT_48384 [Astrocystis sublimbata]
MQFSIALLAAALAGLSSASPTPADITRRFVSGNCGLHVTQWQKHEHGVDSQYEFDVILKDAIGATVGGASRMPIADYSSASISSDLPDNLEIRIGSVDSDSVSFAYAGQAFSSSQGCSTGAYDSGNRDMDCGFQC